MVALGGGGGGVVGNNVLVLVYEKFDSIVKNINSTFIIPTVGDPPGGTTYLSATLVSAPFQSC